MSNFPVASCAIDLLLIDMFSPFDLEWLGLLAAALCHVEPFVRERAAHAAKHSAIDQIPDRTLPSRPMPKRWKERLAALFRIVSAALDESLR